MLTSVLLLIVLLGLPLLINWLENRSKIVRWLSPIIICYLIGIFIGNIPGLSLDQEFLTLIAAISVFLAIPLLLFSAHFSSMMKQAKPALFAFILGIVSVISCSVLAYFILGDKVGQPDAVSGMMIGVYTGGTTNMSAIGIALGVENEVFILLNSADIVFSGIYFLFLLTIGKRILSLFLPSFKKEWNGKSKQEKSQPEADLFSKSKYVLVDILVSLAVLGGAMGLSYILVPDWTIEKAFPWIILGITTLSIAASFNTRIRKLPQTYSTANYLLLVFALAVGSKANFAELLSASSTLFLFCGFVVFGSVLLHFFLAFIFRIDRDTVIIASTAAIFGPPFIAPVAAVIGNKEIIAIGVALSLIGIAVGNYLGIGLAFVLN